MHSLNSVAHDFSCVPGADYSLRSLRESQTVPLPYAREALDLAELRGAWGKEHQERCFWFASIDCR